MILAEAGPLPRLSLTIFLNRFSQPLVVVAFLASAGPLAAGFVGQPFRGFGQPVLCTRRGEAPRSADSLRVGVCVSSGSPRPSDRCEVVSLRVCWFRVLGVCGGPGRVHTRRPPQHGTGEGSTGVKLVSLRRLLTVLALCVCCAVPCFVCSAVLCVLCVAVLLRLISPCVVLELLTSGGALARKHPGYPDLCCTVLGCVVL